MKNMDVGEKANINILTTKDTGLLGAVAETLAWQYLYKKGFLAFAFGAGRPWFTGTRVGWGILFCQGWLNSKQLNYLNDLSAHGPRRWDFVAKERKGNKIYLAEVKATRGQNKRHDLRGLMKGIIPQDLVKIKDIGFRPILIIVQFSDNWIIDVTDMSL
jgi:hypothetical protein